MSGFHGAFATGVACHQGTLTLPDTWFRPPFWDLLMLQLLRPNSSNLPCLYSTFHLEYPLVLSRFCSSVLEMRIWSILLSLFSYCKSQAKPSLRFLQIICPTHIFRFSRGGGGVNFNISSSLYFHFLIKFRLLLSICGLHFWCPLNLKMLPSPLYNGV